MVKLLLLVTAAIPAIAPVVSEFVFYDFNGTTGLALNGDAATTSCTHIARNDYAPLAGAEDVREASLEMEQHQRLEQVVLETVATENHTESARIAVETALLGHRDTFGESEASRCAVRLRLTGSQPHQLASAWFAEPLPVLEGFETSFTFQITDQSRRCYEVVDENFALRRYRSCAVHGGDGLALVLHSHANETQTLGRGAMSWAGIANSLAIEFDTWSNGDDDTFYDHVVIYSRGQEVNEVLEQARLSSTALHDLADGRIHAVTVRYDPELRYEYVPYFSATSHLPAFIRDVSEGRRVGTLSVFMDDGIGRNEPILAIPINLAATLRLDQDLAYMGFTASTGKSWQKHDILGWYYCTKPPCLDTYGVERTFEFDYSQQSMVSTALHGQSVAPIYIYPDTTPWAKKQTYFAPDQQLGLVS